jgi:hypothetical protein
MCGMRDAPQIWAGEVQHTSQDFGFQESLLQPPAYYRQEKSMLVTVHVDVFLMSGGAPNSEGLHDSIHNLYDLTCTVLSKDRQCDCQHSIDRRKVLA